MQRIPCPYCGERLENEFKYGGPSHLNRPTPAKEVSDADWAEYLFMRDNTKGYALERWGHIHGCSQYFNLVRHSVSHHILGAYKMGEGLPEELKDAISLEQKK